MAEDLEHYSMQGNDVPFDYEGIVAIASGAGRRRRPAAGLIATKKSQTAYQKDFFLPAPKISQRKKSTFGYKRGRLLSSVFTNRDDQIVEQELADMYAYLEQQNDAYDGKGTIKLPSDFLYRRKSRYDMYAYLEQQNDAYDGKGTIKLPSDFLYRRKSRQVENINDELDGQTYHRIGLEFNAETLNINQLARLNAQKRALEENTLLTGCSQIRGNIVEAYRSITFLGGVLHRIQGRFGSAVMEYFAFVKWLFLVNLLITLMTLPIIAPQLFLSPENFNENVKDIPGDGTETRLLSALHCTNTYQISLSEYKANRSGFDIVADFIQGTGYFEDQVIFYGSYFNKSYFNLIQQKETTYDMQLAFLLVLGAIFFISIILLLWSLSSYLTSAVVNSQDRVKSKFCNVLLANWDYGLSDKKAVKLKRGLLHQELNLMKASQEYEDNLAKRTTRQKIALYTIRVVINLLVIGILLGSGIAIFKVQEKSREWLEENNSENLALELFYEYLPTGVITAMYLIIPLIFYVLVKAEAYAPETELTITIFRILLIRLASLGLLLWTIVIGLIENQNTCEQESEQTCGHCTSTTDTSARTQCWETYIGQQIYKLVILDFVVMLLVTFLIEYPRQAIYQSFHKKIKLLEWMGQQEFDMPKNVMDVMYNQTLCWIGVFFCPFVPIMVLFKIGVFFWVKKASLFNNQKPSVTLSKSSDVFSLFLWVMILSLGMSFLTLIICLQFVEPSTSCGPFRIHPDSNYRFLDAINFAIADWPQQFHNIVNVITSIPIAIMIIFILSLSIYYHMAISSGSSSKINLFVDTLRLGVKDKQFILKAVNEAAKKEHNKKKQHKVSHLETKNHDDTVSGKNSVSVGAADSSSQSMYYTNTSELTTPTTTNFKNIHKKTTPNSETSSNSDVSEEFGQATNMNRQMFTTNSEDKRQLFQPSHSQQIPSYNNKAFDIGPLNANLDRRYSDDTREPIFYTPAHRNYAYDNE